LEKFDASLLFAKKKLKFKVFLVETLRFQFGKRKLQNKKGDILLIKRKQLFGKKRNL